MGRHYASLTLEEVALARMVRAALAATVLSSVVMVVAAPGNATLHADPAVVESVVESAVHSPEGSDTVSDPQLLEDVAQAQAARTEGGPATVAVEVLTDDPAAVAATVVALGGTVTGSVPGAVLEAQMPVGRIDALARADAADFVQAPRRVGYLPDPSRRTEAGTGPTMGSQVGITNATAWQNAGFTGAGVKVGVVDYFYTNLWNVTELGPKPTVGNGREFCSDNAGWGLCLGDGSINSDPNTGDLHGLAVVEIIKDMAPDAEIYIATVGTVSDLQAAINWFASKGVSIVSRSLGSPYDGPGDGTGPIGAVVNSAASKGITWFNSGGNNAQEQYVRRTFGSTVSNTFGGVTGQYVDWDPGPGIDTWLRLDATSFSCVLFDGVRWANDWYLPAAQRTDYSLEFWEPTSSANQFNDHWNPTATSQIKGVDLNPFLPGIQNVYDANQRAGASPLEADDLCVGPDNDFGPGNGIVFMRMKRNAATPVGNPDTVEVALASGWVELDYDSAPGTGGKAVVDSQNGALVSVGAVDPPAGNAIGFYSSQGPTNDGRIKPDMSAPAGFVSTIYGTYYPEDPTFSGTSAAAPTAAGAAALLLGAGLATPGAGLAALTKHFSTDLGAPGPDNVFGRGKLLLPAPPTPAPTATPGTYVPLPLPVRALDTRPGVQHVGPASLTGPYLRESIIDFDVLGETIVPDTGVSAVVINLTSVQAPVNGFVQAYPYLRATTGRTSTLNISTPGAARPNFAIVPVGQDGKISVYLQAGGNVVIDVLGYYADGQVGPIAEGRFVALEQPERWADSRGLNDAPLFVGFTEPRRTNAAETVDVPVRDTTLVPSTGVAALVVNIAAAGAAGTGYIQAVPTGATGAVHANVNYIVGVASANTAIIPLGIDSGISVFTSQSTHVIVDVVGYITDDEADADTLGLFLPITPGRAVDTRTSSPFAAGEARSFTLAGLAAPAPEVPAGVSAVSANIAVVSPVANGFLKVYPFVEPETSSLNFGAGKTVANASLLAVDGNGKVNAKMSQAGHVVVDINGYFLAGAA